MDSIKFDSNSKQGLIDIKRVLSSEIALHTVIFSSVWLLMLVEEAANFGKNNLLRTETEWDSWAAALKAVKPTTRARVRQIADFQALDHAEPMQHNYWLRVAREAAK